MVLTFGAQKEAITEEQIKVLVDRFYMRVREDAVLGPVFAQAIGHDWAPHLQTMYSFWSSLMRASGRYKGNPMVAHFMLPRIGSQHFERWLALWKQTTSELFPEQTAAILVQKAESMAERMLESLGTYHDGYHESPR
jgi:hemoglobin